MEKQDAVKHQESITEPKPQKELTWFGKAGYTAFVLLALYFLLFGKDWSDAVMQFGIALVFDPFDPKQPWQQRPRYQRVWLLAHVTLLLAGFVVMLLQ
jgi:hypothetical protein